MTSIKEIDTETLKNKIVEGAEVLLPSIRSGIEKYLNSESGISILTVTSVYTAIGMLLEQLTVSLVEMGEDPNIIKGCAGGLLAIYEGAKAHREELVEKYPYLKDSTYREIPIGEV